MAGSDPPAACGDSAVGFDVASSPQHQAAVQSGCLAEMGQGAGGYPVSLLDSSLLAAGFHSRQWCFWHFCVLSKAVSVLCAQLVKKLYLRNKLSCRDCLRVTLLCFW